MLSNDQIQTLRANAAKGEPDAQFLLSQICLQNKDLEGMIHWLCLASESGLPVAHEVLGHCFEKGRGISRNFNEALTHYDFAILNDSHLASYRKAELLYKSRQGPASENTIYDLLVDAAKQGIVPALRTLGYLAMQNEQTEDLAVDCLRCAALAGDPVSGFNLGWYLQRQGHKASQPEAIHCLRLAATNKYPFADSLLATSQTIQPRTGLPIAPGEIKFPTFLALYPVSQTVNSQKISIDPPITLFKNVLNAVDCAYLIFVSRPSLKRADVIDPNSQRDGQVSNVRTNMSTFLPFDAVDIISRYVELKIIRGTNEDLLYSEPMSILHYATGQQYAPHFDFFDPDLDVSMSLLKDGGQRTASAVTYLAAPAIGGGTSFPNLNIQVPAIAGATLWFRNCTSDGKPDPRSLHGGDPVMEGEKWAVTKWFREKPTRYLEF